MMRVLTEKRLRVGMLQIACFGLPLTMATGLHGAEGTIRRGLGNRTSKGQPVVVEALPRRPERLFLCDQVFVLDGNIREFVDWGNNSQEYFITDWMDPNFGKIKDEAYVCADFIAVDSTPPAWRPDGAGPTGFEDNPSAWNGSGPAPTGFNLGRLFFNFDLGQDPDRDASNGRGVYFIGIDVSAPRDLDTVAWTQPLAFDIDGDGDCSTAYECGGVREFPTMGEDVYMLGIDTNSDGITEVFVIVGEQLGSLPDNSISIDPRDRPQTIDGMAVRRYVEFRDATGLLPESPSAQALRFLDCHCDGNLNRHDFGIGEDIELAVLNVTGLPGNSRPTGVTIRVWADAADDGMEDDMVLEAVFPPSLGFDADGDNDAE